MKFARGVMRAARLVSAVGAREALARKRSPCPFVLEGSTLGINFIHSESLSLRGIGRSYVDSSSRAASATIGRGHDTADARAGCAGIHAHERRHIPGDRSAGSD